MPKKGLVILGLAGAVGLALALTKKAEAAPPVPPPPHVYKYTCRFGDGFATDSWAEMFQHYSTVHPEAKIMDVEIKWV